MQKSGVRGFYGNVPRFCCQTEPIDESKRDESKSPKKILPYSVWHEANFHYQMETDKYESIANELGIEPRNCLTP